MQIKTLVLGGVVCVLLLVLSFLLSPVARMRWEEEKQRRELAKEERFQKRIASHQPPTRRSDVVVPEPSSQSLLLFGILALQLRRSRRQAR